MTLHTGRWGMVNGATKIRNWSIQDGYADNTLVHSGTEYGTDRENGPYDWSGSFSAYGHSPIVMPGEYLSFIGYRAPDATDDADNGDRYSGQVYIDSVAITINFQTNEVISHVVNFGGNGDLTIAQGVEIAGGAASANPTPCAGKIVTFVSGSPDVETILQHVTQATLTFSKPAITSVNSGTTAGSEKCITMREAGPAIDWTMSITTEEGVRNTSLIPGSNHKWRVYVTSSDFWELVWGKINDITGLTVDRETGAIISQTYNVAMKSHLSGVTGNITKPGAGTNWWPAA